MMNHFFQTDISFEPHSIITIKDTSRKEETPDELQQIFNKTFNEQEEELVGFVDDGEVHRPELEFNRFFAWYGSGPIKSSKLASDPKLEDIQPLRQVTIQCELNKPTKRVHTTIVAADDTESKPKKKKKEEQEILETPATTNTLISKAPKKKDKKKMSKFLNSLKGDSPLEKIDNRTPVSSIDSVSIKSEVKSDGTKPFEVVKSASKLPVASKIQTPVILFGDLKSGMSKSSNLSQIGGKPSANTDADPKLSKPIKSRSPQKKKDKFDDLFTVHGLLFDFDTRFKDSKKIVPGMSKAIDTILLNLLESVAELPFSIYERLSLNSAISPTEFKSFIQSNSLPKLVPKVDADLAATIQNFEKAATALNFNTKLKLMGVNRLLGKAITYAHMAHMFVHGHLECDQGEKGIADKKIRTAACEKAASMFHEAVDVKRFQKLLVEEKKRLRSGVDDLKSQIMTKAPIASPTKDPAVLSYEEQLEGLFNHSESVPKVSPTAVNYLPYPQVAPALKEAAKKAQIAKTPQMEKLKFGNSNALPPLNMTVKPALLAKPTINKPSPLKVMPPYAKYAIENKSAKSPKKDADDVINLLSD